MSKNINSVDLTQINENSYSRRSVGCLIKSHDGKIVLQQRPQNWHRFPGCLATFGGGIDPGETPMQALVRELKEELGASVNPADVISLGAITETRDLIYVYFWQDKHNTITGCYEGEAIYYDDDIAALAHPKIMPDVRWLLKKCKLL